MTSTAALPVLGLAVSGVAVLIWAVVFVRTMRAYLAGIEHRVVWLTMATGALLASLGTLASAVGFAIQRGVLPEVLHPDALSFLASVGRGALLMSGLIVLTHYRPPKVRS